MRRVVSFHFCIFVVGVRPKTVFISRRSRGRRGTSPGTRTLRCEFVQRKPNFALPSSAFPLPNIVYGRDGPRSQTSVCPLRQT